MASFFKNNTYQYVLLTEGLLLISNEVFIDDVIHKVHLNKLWNYQLQKVPVLDTTTILVFRHAGIKTNINNHDVIYIGDLQKLFALKQEN